jgi:hypothetical protein
VPRGGKSNAQCRCRNQRRGPEYRGGRRSLGAGRDLLADLACALFPPHFDGTEFILNMCGEICAKSTVKSVRQDVGEVHD